MHRLRSCRLLTRLIVAWWLAALGVAMASPIVQPGQMALVCSAGGALKLVLVAGDGSAAQTSAHTLDCVLCLPMLAPPPASAVGAERLLRLSAPALPGEAESPWPARAGAPLPARGPPRA